MRNCFKPGKVWLDTEGKRIQAHGGSVIYVDGTYYWYGENKEKTTGDNGIWHWGVRLYSSNDLYNWKDEGLILHPDTEDEKSPIHPRSLMDRPHIIYNEKNKQYVMWIKIMGEPQFMTVAISDTIKGPFKVVGTVYPCDISSGDFDLVKDENGKAYIIFEQVHTSIIVADLTDDYLNVTGNFTRHFKRERPPFVREAPAHFEKDGKHYLFTSGTSGYLPNPTEVAVTDDLHGEWTELGDPHVNDPKGDSFCSQITSVFKVPHKDLYIALADRWVPSLVERDDINGHKLFDTLFDPNTPEPKKEKVRELFRSVASNTSEADYVWLPVEWQDGKPVLRWYDEWTID